MNSKAWDMEQIRLHVEMCVPYISSADYLWRWLGGCGLVFSLLALSPCRSPAIGGAFVCAVCAVHGGQSSCVPPSPSMTDNNTIG